VPQPPQFFASLIVSTHTPLQTVVAQTGPPSWSAGASAASAASAASVVASGCPDASSVVASTRGELPSGLSGWKSWKFQRLEQAVIQSKTMTPSHAVRRNITTSPEEEGPRPGCRPSRRPSSRQPSARRARAAHASSASHVHRAIPLARAPSGARHRRQPLPPTCVKKAPKVLSGKPTPYTSSPWAPVRRDPRTGGTTALPPQQGPPFPTHLPHPAHPARRARQRQGGAGAKAALASFRDGRRGRRSTTGGRPARCPRAGRASAPGGADTSDPSPPCARPCSCCCRRPRAEPGGSRARRCRSRRPWRS
jgi:hypothetical protein